MFYNILLHKMDASMFYNNYPNHPNQSNQPNYHFQYKGSNGKALIKKAKPFRYQSHPYKSHPYESHSTGSHPIKRGQNESVDKPYRNMNHSTMHPMQPMKKKSKYHNQERTVDIRHNTDMDSIRQYQEPSKIVKETFLDTFYRMCEEFRSLQEEQRSRTEMFRQDSLNNEMRQNKLVDELQSLASTNAKEWFAKEEAFKCVSKSRLIESKSKYESQNEEGSGNTAHKVILNFSKSEDESNDESLSGNDSSDDDESDTKST